MLKRDLNWLAQMREETHKGFKGMLKANKRMIKGYTGWKKDRRRSDRFVRKVEKDCRVTEVNEERIVGLKG